MRMLPVSTVVLACGTVDLRKGINGLATIIGDRYGQNPFEKGTLFLFCGKRSDRCKGLLLGCPETACFYWKTGCFFLRGKIFSPGI